MYLAMWPISCFRWEREEKGVQSAVLGNLLPFKGIMNTQVLWCDLHCLHCFEKWTHRTSSSVSGTSFHASAMYSWHGNTGFSPPAFFSAQQHACYFKSKLHFIRCNTLYHIVELLPSDSKLGSVLFSMICPSSFLCYCRLVILRGVLLTNQPPFLHSYMKA